MFRFLLRRRFTPGQVHTRWVPSTRRVLPEVEAAIDQAWAETTARPGVRLFDGPVCRFEGLHEDGPTLTIDLSRSSYRIIVGTHFANPHFADSFGPDVMANPLGVSTGLLTADGFVMMGRRNRSVAYYPDRVHPFAGSLEVEENVDVFENVQRELSEELSLSPGELASMLCLGLAEDTLLRHPETIYMTNTTRTRDEIERQVDVDEHHAAWHVAAEPDAIAAAVTRDADLTPMARAVLLAWGHDTFGSDWAAHVSRSIEVQS